jgi:hypothetical protein
MAVLEFTWSTVADTVGVIITSHLPYRGLLREPLTRGGGDVGACLDRAISLRHHGITGGCVGQGGHRIAGGEVRGHGHGRRLGAGRGQRDDAGKRRVVISPTTPTRPLLTLFSGVT